MELPCNMNMEKGFSAGICLNNLIKQPLWSSNDFLILNRLWTRVKIFGVAFSFLLGWLVFYCGFFCLFGFFSVCFLEVFCFVFGLWIFLL